MTTVPDRARVRLPGISSRAYEHPADRSALVALRKLTGFDALFRRLASLFSDRSLRLLFLASSVRATQEQFPQLHRLLLDGASILDLPEVPELFISQDPIPNAMALGSDKPFIVITTGLVNLLDTEEMRFVIGHELGHCLSGHTVYRTMLYKLTQLAARLAWFAIAYLSLRAFVVALEEWYRKSELSCDRAGVLAGQDPAAGRRALMKIAGGSRMSELSHDEFLRQAEEYDAVADVRESIIKILQLLGQTHHTIVITKSTVQVSKSNFSHPRRRRLPPPPSPRTPRAMALVASLRRLLQHSLRRYHISSPSALARCSSSS